MTGENVRKKCRSSGSVCKRVRRRNKSNEYCDQLLSVINSGRIKQAPYPVHQISFPYPAMVKILKKEKMKFTSEMCLNFGTPKIINFPFETNGKFMVLGVSTLKAFGSYI